MDSQDIPLRSLLPLRLLLRRPLHPQLLPNLIPKMPENTRFRLFQIRATEFLHRLPGFDAMIMLISLSDGLVEGWGA